MLNLTYLYWSQKSLLRSICGPSRGSSNPYNHACRYGNTLYYNGCSYSGRSPRRASYSRKTSLRGTRNSLATSSKNYGGSPLRDNAYSTPYIKNGLSYRKMTYKGACRAWKRTCLAFSLYTIGRYYIQLLAIQRVPSRLALYSQQAIGYRLSQVAEDIAKS